MFNLGVRLKNILLVKQAFYSWINFAMNPKLKQILMFQQQKVVFFIDDNYLLLIWSGN